MLDVVEGLLKEASEGGGADAMALVLDKDSPFMELSPLAAYSSGVKDGSGLVTGIGVISGTECVIVVNDLRWSQKIGQGHAKGIIVIL
jgi:acetyl-CoA carboxylase carboxyltransferase component